MESHNDLTDVDFAQRFKACSLAPELFTHEAHLRLAWIHLETYGETIAIQNISAQLRAYVSFWGAQDKYNHTLTVAAIQTVHHFKQRSNAATFKTFIAEFPRLNTDFKALIAQHYTMDIFNEPKAKLEYLVPDLLPFR